MLEKLKKRELIASIPTLLLKIGLGIVLLIYSGIFTVLMGPTPLSHLDASKLEGEYVSYDLWLSFDCFAEMITTSDGAETSNFRDYLIATDEYYMAVRIYPSDYEKMDRLTEDSFAWLDYETDDLPEEVHVTGVVQQMDSDELSYYYEYIGLSRTEAENYGYLTLVIDTHAVRADGMDAVTSSIIALLGIASLLWAVWSVYGALRLRHHQDIVKLLKEEPDAEEELSQWMEGTRSVHGLRVNEKWCLWESKKATHLSKTEDVLWAYQHVTTHRYYFVAVGKSHSLVIGLQNGRFWTIPMGREEDVKEAMALLGKMHPRIVLGYSKELADLFSKDREKFSHLRDETLL